MKELANEIVAWLKDYAIKNNRKSFVVGISGGVDSALVSTLCAMTGLPTHCVMLPCQSKEEEVIRAGHHILWLTKKFLNVHASAISLADTFNEFKQLTTNLGMANDLAYANAKSRLRMIALYHIATIKDGLVVGTGNKIEDYNIFFYTKYGDGAIDIAPIADLTKTEVRQMARDLGILSELTEAIPTDGLWEDGRSDEDAIGATYEELEWAMDWFNKSDKYKKEYYSALLDRERKVLDIYNKWHTAGKHKAEPIPTFKRKQNMLKIAERNKSGKVSILTNDGQVATAKVPPDRSMLSVIGVSGIVNGAEYKNDGWVYLNNKPIHKWHVMHNGIRLWEPRLKDLPTLYRQWKQTKTANEKAWDNIIIVLRKLWGNHKVGNAVRAHAIPVHGFKKESNTDPWWEYRIENYNGEGLSFSFSWLDKKPKQVLNPILGQKLYELEHRWFYITNKRLSKVQQIFFEAMRKSLPTATENKVISLQFENDSFWFYSVSKGPKCVWWEQFNNRYEFEMKRIV